MIITISGNIGSGKSGIGRRLAKEFGWPYYDMGGLRREFAAKRNMTLEEYNELGESDPTTDTEVDQYHTKLGQDFYNIVIGGRSSCHFIPKSL